MPRPNLYKLLGVDRAATPDAIRAAYRALAKSLHPDRNPSHDAAPRFAAIAEAYEVLGDRSRRAAYDASLESAADRPSSGAAKGHYSWSNVAAPTTSEGPADISEFDELYDTFFMRPNHAQPGRDEAQTAKKRARSA